jgi:hypothetical protein
MNDVLTEYGKVVQKVLRGVSGLIEIVSVWSRSGSNQQQAGVRVKVVTRSLIVPVDIWLGVRLVVTGDERPQADEALSVCQPLASPQMQTSKSP